MTRLHTRLANEEGTALIIALMAMLLLTALAAAVVMVSSTEVKIAGNYNNGQETLYAADAAVERVVQDLLLIPRWNDILAGSVKSALIDGPDTTLKSVPGGPRSCSCCAANSVDGPAPGADRYSEPVGREQPEVEAVRLRAAEGHAAGCRDRQRELHRGMGCGRPGRQHRRREPRRRPAHRLNGTLTLHAEAFGPTGTHKVIEVTVARTSGHRNRARPDRAARSGRAEPALAEGRRPDAREDADQHADEHVHGQSGGAVMANPTQIQSVARTTPRRLAVRRPPPLAGVFAALTVTSLVSATLLAQLDPLLFIKRVPRRSSSSWTRRADARGRHRHLLRSDFYKVSDDPTVMGAFPNIDTVTTKTYRRDVPATFSTRRRLASTTADSIAAIAAAWDPANPLTSTDAGDAATWTRRATAIAKRGVAAAVGENAGSAYRWGADPSAPEDAGLARVAQLRLSGGVGAAAQAVYGDVRRATPAAPENTLSTRRASPPPATRRRPRRPARSWSRLPATPLSSIVTIANRAPGTTPGSCRPASGASGTTIVRSPTRWTMRRRQRSRQ